MNASVSAGVVVERKVADSLAIGREVLFVLRKDGTYGIPAGHLNNETPRQCAVREFLEETGYEVTLEGLIKVVTLSAGNKHPVSIGFIFRGKIGNCVGKAELELEWINSQRFLELLGQDKIYLPQFHTYAFWGENVVPVGVVLETVV